MPRHPEGPRFRKDCESWVVMMVGRLHTLARGKANKAEARRRFLELLAERDRAAHERADPPVGLAIARYLADLRRRVERGELSASS